MKNDLFPASSIRRVRRLLGLAGLLIGVLSMVFGCASPPPAPLVLEIVNELGRSIARVERKGCDESESRFHAIDDSALAPGQTRHFTMPAYCIDLVAEDGRGRVVGQQRGLRMVQGARWVLRR